MGTYPDDLPAVMQQPCLAGVKGLANRVPGFACPRFDQLSLKVFGHDKASIGHAGLIRSYHWQQRDAMLGRHTGKATH